MRLSLIALALLSACADETVTGYGGAGTWLLTELNGGAYPARLTLTLTEGDISGEAPCNRFSAIQTAPYPWFAASPITSTRRACPELPAEQAALTTLGQMTAAEAFGDRLLLSNPSTGAEMLFTRAPADQ